MEKVNAGVALLCRKLILDCIKVEMSKKPCDIGGRLVYPYSIERGGKAVIATPIPVEERPCQYLNETELMYEEGDSLNGKRLWGCADKPNRTYRRDVGSSKVRSGRHSRQGVEILGEECYILIVSSWSSDSVKIMPSDYVKQYISDTVHELE